MAKPAKRRRARQAAKLRPGPLPSIGENPIEQGPALLRPGERESVEDPLDDSSDDDAAQDAWLLERVAEDMQRDNH
jgi:hypothetical protein